MVGAARLCCGSPRRARQRLVFKKGHRIWLDIQPRDGVGSAHYMHYHADYNTGTNTVYAGGEMDSHLLLPVIPPNR